MSPLEGWVLLVGYSWLLTQFNQVGFEYVGSAQKEVDAQKEKIEKLEKGIDVDDSKPPGEDNGANEATEDESTDSQ